MTNDEFLQHFSHFVDAPNGMQKLRELILQLAVQGKLVPQDLNEEPAPILLDRLKKERKNLIKGKKLRKTIAAPNVESSEKLFEVPKNWVWCRLSDTGNIFNGNSISARVKSEKYEGIDDGLPYIATKDVGYGREELAYENGIKIPYGEEKFKVAHANSVLICSEGGSAGRKIGYSTKDICFGNKLYAVEAFSGVNPLYIFYLYQSLSFFSAFKEKMTGIIGGISLNNFVSLPIPLPPTSEQFRIVTKIDDLMALCDRLESENNARDVIHRRLIHAVHHPLTESINASATMKAWDRIRENFADLYTTLESVQALRQTILQLAVQGKLVSQNPNDEPASRLLAGIYQENQSATKKPNVKKVSGIPENNEAFPLPATWKWARLGNLLDNERDISYGIIKLGDEPSSDGVKTLRCSDVRFRRIIPKQARSVKKTLSDEYSRTILKGGEVLMNIRGTLGGCGLVDDELAGFNIAREVAMIPVHTHLNSRYILDVISSPLIQENTLRNLRGIAYKGLNLGLLRNFRIPIPPIEEQYRIVSKIDEFMTLCDQLDEHIRYKNDTTTSYTEAIVHQIAAE